MSKVFVGGLHHESDTFNPIVTGKKDIWVTRGADLLVPGRHDSASGVIQTLLKNGIEVVPSLVARAVPNGEWDKDYYVLLRDEMLSDLKAAMPVDGICLAIHGSMRVKGLGAAEGDLLERIRAIAPDVPLFASLDMHATVTERMLENCDGFAGYKCAPHTDTFETGALAATMTIRTLREGLHPKMAAVHLPFMVAGEQSETSVAPMLGLMSTLRSLERLPGMLAMSCLLGFPWADTAENGTTIIAVSESDQDLANEKAVSFAKEFWAHRADFRFYNETHEEDDALVAARESIEDGVWPVVISDSGDNPTAGSSQDQVAFLAKVINDPYLSHLDPPFCYQAIYDIPICHEALEKGVGATITGSLGAKYDTTKSKPLAFTGKVVAVHPGWEGAQGAAMALLLIGGVHVIVTDAHVGCYDPEMMRALSVVPEEQKAIVVKLGYLEPEIRAIAKRSMMALTYGSSNEIFTRLPYKHITRPVYPLDKEVPVSFEPIVY